MKFTLQFDMDNAAFEPDPTLEIARILDRVRRHSTLGYQGDIIQDINGNTVGRWDIEPDQEHNT